MNQKYLELLMGCLTRTAIEDLSPEQYESRRIGMDPWTLCGETMIGHVRLGTIQSCAELLFRENVPGDFLEAGVWRGGASIFMRACVTEEPDRRVWVADSFEGLPESRHSVDLAHDHEYKDWGSLAVSLDRVASNFKRYGLLDDRVLFLKGWFKDTLPGPVEQLALLRVDCDMYESVTQTLEALYDKISPGGVVIIDDYGLASAKEATDDFRKKYNIKEPLRIVDWTEVWWRKR